MNENKPISEKELLAAIKDLLKKNGHLNKLTAEMRAKVTEILQQRQTSGDKKSGPPALSEEVLLVNELVREYLEWNGYLYTASVMASEAAMPVNKRTRSELCTDVGVRDDEKSSALPLLSNIVTAYTERIKRKISKSKK
ncbi:centrosomal protein 20 [Manduca sexta]|uniref:FGFR1 oncogene partner (FOP) N-terminal dimerisation domain-containing protein n=1 Tax=Manduca sexta TaxID=7130 RepID=A0A921ZB03_MANSE|nr:centrosomal protein 20 [Manduca sexta]KAG6453579.1 hypothetical protein O3G_MSEX008228 [Manduca sexta]